MEAVAEKPPVFSVRQNPSGSDVAILDRFDGGTIEESIVPGPDGKPRERIKRTIGVEIPETDASIAARLLGKHGLIPKNPNDPIPALTPEFEAEYFEECKKARTQSSSGAELAYRYALRVCQLTSGRFDGLSFDELSEIALLSPIPVNDFRTWIDLVQGVRRGK